MTTIGCGVNIKALLTHLSHQQASPADALVPSTGEKTQDFTVNCR
jgi:hypothetical protein